MHYVGVVIKGRILGHTTSMYHAQGTNQDISYLEITRYHMAHDQSQAMKVYGTVAETLKPAM